MSASSRPGCQLFLRGRCHYGAACKYAHEAPTSPAGSSLSGSDDGRDADSSQRRLTNHPPPPAYPVRPAAPDCQYYLKTGKCNYGVRCRFNHPHRDERLVSALNRRDCFDFVQTGTCPYGKSCKYNHPARSDVGSPVSRETVAADGSNTTQCASSPGQRGEQQQQQQQNQRHQCQPQQSHQQQQLREQHRQPEQQNQRSQQQQQSQRQHHQQQFQQQQQRQQVQQQLQQHVAPLQRQQVHSGSVSHTQQPLDRQQVSAASQMQRQQAVSVPVPSEGQSASFFANPRSSPHAWSDLLFASVSDATQTRTSSPAASAIWSTTSERVAQSLGCASSAWDVAVPPASSPSSACSPSSLNIGSGQCNSVPMWNTSTPLGAASLTSGASSRSSSSRIFASSPQPSPPQGTTGSGLGCGADALQRATVSPVSLGGQGGYFVYVPSQAPSERAGSRATAGQQRPCGSDIAATSFDGSGLTGGGIERCLVGGSSLPDWRRGSTEMGSVKSSGGISPVSTEEGRGGGDYAPFGTPYETSLFSSGPAAWSSGAGLSSGSSVSSGLGGGSSTAGGGHASLFDLLSEPHRG